MTFIPSSAGAASAAGFGLGSFAPWLLLGSSFLGGLSRRRAARESARLEQENAIAAKVRGYFQERGLKLEQGSLLSEIRNRSAGAGLDPDAGSPLETYLQAARESELDILHARSTADAEYRARMLRAGLLRRGGDAELLGSLLGGAADLVRLKTYAGKNNVYFTPSS